MIPVVSSEFWKFGNVFLFGFMSIIILVPHCIGSSPYAAMLRLLVWIIYISEASYQPDLLEPLAFLKTAVNAHCCKQMFIGLLPSVLTRASFFLWEKYLRKIFDYWNLFPIWDEIYEIVHMLLFCLRKFIHPCCIVSHTQFSKYMLYFPYQ